MRAVGSSGHRRIVNSMCSQKEEGSYKKRSRTVAAFGRGKQRQKADQRCLFANSTSCKFQCQCAAERKPKCGLHSCSSWLTHTHTERFGLERKIGIFAFRQALPQCKHSRSKAEAPGEHPNIQFGWAVLFSHFPNSGPLSSGNEERDFRKLQSSPEKNLS